MENEENYVEVPSEETYDDEEFTFGDFAFMAFFCILGCAVFAFVVKVVSKHLKNVKLKVGSVEVGVESKDDLKEEKQKINN